MNIPDGAFTISEYRRNESCSVVIRATATLSADCLIHDEVISAARDSGDVKYVRAMMIAALMHAIRTTPEAFLHLPGAEVERIATPEMYTDTGGAGAMAE